MVTSFLQYSWDQYMETDKQIDTAGGASERRDPPGGKRLSGAARRKLKKLRNAEAVSPALKTEGVEGQGNACTVMPCTSTKPGQGTGKANPTKETGDQKRARSNGSTSSDRRPTKISRESKPATVADIRAVIMSEGYPNKVLSNEQAEQVRAALIASIDDVKEGTPAPRFTEVKYWGGLLHVSCADEATRVWLEFIVAKCSPWEGAKLVVTNGKDVPKPVRALTWIPGPPEEPEKVLKRLETQNPGLCTEAWKVVDIKVDPKGQRFIVIMEENSWNKIQELQGRLYLNLTRILFKPLGTGASASGTYR